MRIGSRRTLARTLALTTACALATACGRVDIDGDDGIPAGATFIASEEVISETYSGIEDRRRVVIRTDAEWRTFWNELTANRSPRPPRPRVDFSREVIIAAALGTRRTGGYEIAIDRVYRTPAGLVAVVTGTRPAPDCLLTQALTAPAYVARARATEEPVRFVEEEVVRECG